MSQAVQNDNSQELFTDWGSDLEYGSGSLDDAEYNDQSDTLTVEGEREHIHELEANPNLPASAKAELEQLQGKVDYSLSLSPESQASALAEVEDALKALTDPKAAKDLPIDEQIKNFLTDHPELDKAMQNQLNKWVASYELDPSSGATIAKEFQDVRSQATNTEVYGSVVSRLAAVTGMKASEVQAIFTKHGITNAENLSDKQIQEVLPELGGKKLEKAQGNLQKAQQSLQKAWDTASNQAEKVNSTNRTGDETDNNFSCFRTLADIANHKDPKSKGYQDALTGVAEACAPILAALKGVPEDKVKVLHGSPSKAETHAGMLSIDGKSVNVIGNPRTGSLALSSDNNGWPKYNLNHVKVFINSDTVVPDWMKTENYPYQVEGGGDSGLGGIGAVAALGPFAWIACI